MACCISYISINPWVGCGGKIYTDEQLNEFLKIAVEAERYEYAAEVRDELIRRKEEKKGSWKVHKFENECA